MPHSYSSVGLLTVSLGGSIQPVESWNSKAIASRVSGSPSGSLGVMVSRATPASPPCFPDSCIPPTRA